MAFTQTDLDNLKTALLTGAMEVQIGERRIRYRSQSEIMQLIKLVQAELDGESTDTTTKVIKATFSKGEA